MLLLNPFRKVVGQDADTVDVADFSPAVAQRVRAFHASFSQYCPTPLVALPGLAGQLGLKSVCVKDESKRFGLNAFKVLGGSYAVARCLAERLNLPEQGLTKSQLHNTGASTAADKINFISTTDGNHGRGLAWAARELGYPCIIYMPKGSEPARRDNILALGAQCTITDLNYDDTVRMSWNMAQEKGYVMVQDTAWEGYEQIPVWIMQGYLTLAAEILEQMQTASIRPTHCFLQAGVGSFAAAVAAFLVAVMGSDAPRIIIVEPHAANCFYQSALAGDGKAHAVDGSLQTLMAGLACGEPSTLAWSILKDYTMAFMSCPDYMAANGMRMLAAPVQGDQPIVSGESGAAGAGALHWLMCHPAAADQREELGLNAEASVLLISTEGDTVPHIYRSIVWQGAHADEEYA
ncbi:MAG: diaminopropionate ammonia-lyase [Deltaproteobacteria bacterium]|nr:diaminopropionate ammonia-lyase [Deltaproteobacteria bacterium]